MAGSKRKGQTRGPWHIEAQKDGTFTIRNGSRHIIASGIHNEADARLIAMAQRLEAHLWLEIDWIAHGGSVANIEKYASRGFWVRGAEVLAEISPDEAPILQAHDQAHDHDEPAAGDGLDRDTWSDVIEF